MSDAALLTSDAAMRAYAASLPLPEFEATAFKPLTKPLSRARVAIVTSARDLIMGGTSWTLS